MTILDTEITLKEAEYKKNDLNKDISNISDDTNTTDNENSIKFTKIDLT